MSGAPSQAGSPESQLPAKEDEKVIRQAYGEEHERFDSLDKDHGSEADQAARLGLHDFEQASAPAA